MSCTKISHLIESQMPFFVRNDHPQFMAFIKVWLEYNEQSESTLSEGKVLERFKSLPDYFDIDSTHDELEKKFFDWFLEAFPPSTVADRVIILKSAKDFLRARGTEKSVKFLLRAVLGIDDIDVYYPKVDVLRVSDGNWYIQKTLRIGEITIDGVSNTNLSALALLEEQSITGLTSNASAVIEKTDRYYDSGVLVDELTITNPLGTFTSSEQIRANVIVNTATLEVVANVFGGRISVTNIIDGGLGYSIGDEVVVEDANGSGAIIQVSDISTGNVASITVNDGGSGFQAETNSDVLIVGGGGSGANAYVFSVDLSEDAHPNTYSIWSDMILPESDTVLNETPFSGGGLSANDPDVNVNTLLVNAFSSFVYSNTGPVSIVTVRETGDNYTAAPTISATANTRIRSLGIMGKLNIIDGGTGYANGDIIEFGNAPSGYGVGANATVEVDGTGVIVGYDYQEQIGGYPLGGLGYSQDALPILNVATSTGSSANLMSDSILGYGDDLSTALGEIGVIEGLDIVSGGSAYSEPVANLTSIGDGTANVALTSVAGIFSYAGRYLNDDDHISGYSFLEDQSYYQNYSYVIRTKANLADYRALVDDIITPAGVILFGEYMEYDNSWNTSVTTEIANVNQYITVFSTYEANGANIKIDTGDFTHNLATGNTITLEFIDGDTANLENTMVDVSSISNSSIYNVVHDTANSTVETSGNVWAGIFVL